MSAVLMYTSVAFYHYEEHSSNRKWLSVIVSFLSEQHFTETHSSYYAENSGISNIMSLFMCGRK